MQSYENYYWIRLVAVERPTEIDLDIIANAPLPPRTKTAVANAPLPPGLKILPANGPVPPGLKNLGTVATESSPTPLPGSPPPQNIDGVNLAGSLMVDSLFSIPSSTNIAVEIFPVHGERQNAVDWIASKNGQAWAAEAKNQMFFLVRSNNTIYGDDREQEVAK